MEKLKTILKEDTNAEKHCPKPIMNNGSKYIDTLYNEYGWRSKTEVRKPTYLIREYGGWGRDLYVFFIVIEDIFTWNCAAFFRVSSNKNLGRDCIVEKGIKKEYKNVRFDVSGTPEQILINYLKRMHHFKEE